MNMNEIASKVGADNPSFFEAPDFWKSGWEEMNEYLGTLKVGHVWKIGKSEGGHSIPAVAYGEKEPIENKSTYSGAMAAGHFTDFIDLSKRTKPVVVIFVIHGVELEGTVACLNLANIMETGKDLRGRPWKELHELASSMRVILIPMLQVDGRIRNNVKNLIGATIDQLYYYGQGVFKNGKILQWPDCKRMHPIPVAEMARLGGYYNDAGINIQHDDFFSKDMAPETRALFDLFLEEVPDCFLTLHACGNAPVFVGPDNFITQACVEQQISVATAVTARFEKEGLRPHGKPNTEPRGGFYLHTALHHTCGALPLLFEMPHGLEIKPFTFNEILDVGLILFEELLSYGNKTRFQPRW